MFKISVLLIVMTFLVCEVGLKAAPPADSKVLILYDAPSDEPKLGLTYALMLRALMGHFDLSTELHPVADYKAGDVESYRAVFYLGSYYNHPIPDAFLKDVAKTDHRIVWFKYNLWQLTQPRELQFPETSGLGFDEIRGFDKDPSIGPPSFFDTVIYKDRSLKKYFHYDAQSKAVNADPDIGVVQLADPSKAHALVTIKNSETGEQVPYVVQAGLHSNFWYFADIPLSYIGPRDRYLVLCDILHDILEINHPESHHALVRLEDVDAKVDFDSMKTLADYLHSKKIPFSIAVIPKYVDPLGYNNDGTPETITMDQATELKRAVRYAIQQGGSVVMHGYTHQYDSQKNPNTGVSADDYEFWDAVANAPVPEDSESWAMGRLNSGIKALSAHRLTPWAWEPPHYQASPLTYQAMAKRFAISYQRIVYYSSEHPDLHAELPDRDYAAGMFFPYPIHNDSSGGALVVPENLGNIEYDIHETDPTSNLTYTWQDLYENAQDALVVRDGYASFFFHPFWIESDFASLHALQDFKQLVDGISALGYHWMDARKVK